MGLPHKSTVLRRILNGCVSTFQSLFSLKMIQPSLQDNIQKLCSRLVANPSKLQVMYRAFRDRYLSYGASFDAILALVLTIEQT